MKALPFLLFAAPPDGASNVEEVQNLLGPHFQRVEEVASLLEPLLVHPEPSSGADLMRRNATTLIP